MSDTMSREIIRDLLTTGACIAILAILAWIFPHHWRYIAMGATVILMVIMGWMSLRVLKAQRRKNNQVRVTRIMPPDHT